MGTICVFRWIKDSQRVSIVTISLVVMLFMIAADCCFTSTHKFTRFQQNTWYIVWTWRCIWDHLILLISSKTISENCALEVFYSLLAKLIVFHTVTLTCWLVPHVITSFVMSSDSKMKSHDDVLCQNRTSVFYILVYEISCY